MITYIALLRGINVSGQKKVPMADLRSLLEKSGLQNVQTYIQSGNVIFQSVQTEILELESLIQKSIRSHFGFDVFVLVKTKKDLQSILNDGPFSDQKTEQSYFTLLHHAPEINLVDDVKKIDYHNEEFIISDQCVYFYSDAGYGNAKCNNNFFERKLKVTATTRNFKTMTKLLSLCEDLS